MEKAVYILFAMNPKDSKIVTTVLNVHYMSDMTLGLGD